MPRRRQPEPPPAAVEEQAAGAFSPWLAETRRVAKLRTIDADVPCGSCTGCCRASYFIHIRPHEHRALARIPRALLFPAPGAPPGHVLLGYDDQGRCPMLVDERCSIYEDRPQTCREFDCRVFAATGIALDAAGPQAPIAAQVRRWRFELRDETERGELAAVRAAAAFLQARRELFEPGTLPANPAQLAALAIEVVDVFLAEQPTGADGADDAHGADGADGATADVRLPPRRRSDAELARAVVAELQRLRDEAAQRMPPASLPAAAPAAGRLRPKRGRS